MSDDFRGAEMTSEALAISEMEMAISEMQRSSKYQEAL